MLGSTTIFFPSVGSSVVACFVGTVVADVSGRIDGSNNGYFVVFLQTSLTSI